MMRYQICVLLIFIFLACPTGESFGQTDAGFFSRDEIPAAGFGTVQAYYDPFTGDVLVSIGEDIGIFGFGVPSTISDPMDVAILQASFDAINQDAVRGDAIAGTFQNDSSGVAWGGIPLPTGVFDIGPIYEALPPTQAAVQLDSILFTIDTSDPEIFFAELGQRSVEDQIEIERALQGLYGSQPTGFSLVVVALGVEAQVEPIRFLRSELGIAIPEPCSAILIPLAGAGLFLRRRRA